MERRELGRIGIQFPVIGMGTWRTFDTTENRRPLVTAAIDAGIDLFDSSPMYGRAEDTLARAIEGRRERVMIATKVWTDDEDEGRRQAERALGLFGHIDIYQVHNLVNVREQLALLEGLKEQGKVRAVGASHYQESAFDELMDLMSSGRIDMVQVPYNPLRRAAERKLLPLAESLGLGVLVMSPLQHGVLDHRPTADQLKELGVATWAQAILKWIASDRRVATVLTATQRVERVAENACAGEAPFFSDDQRNLVVRIVGR
jgi:aryl-alcohol dehydrogenase-like predicted oxidoreductase